MTNDELDQACEDLGEALALLRKAENQLHRTELDKDKRLWSREEHEQRTAAEQEYDDAQEQVNSTLRAMQSMSIESGTQAGTTLEARGTMYAYLQSWYEVPRRQEEIELGAFSFFSTRLAADGSMDGTYTYAGTAEVALHMIDPNAITNARVAALRTEQADVRAKAEAKITYIEQTIQSLLSISHSKGAA